MSKENDKKLPNFQGSLIAPMPETPFEDAGRIVKQQRLDEQQVRDERIAKLSHTPIKEAVVGWLLNLRESTKKNYKYYAGALLRKGIIKEFRADGKKCTVGDFNSTAHEYTINTLTSSPS